MKLRYRLLILSLFLLSAIANPGPLEAQASARSVVMRSEGIVTWWVVDPGTGQAAFYGGDIVAICRDDPDGYDLVDFHEMEAPGAVATTMVGRGSDVGASLWDHAPPFVMPRLCTDILSRGAPLAVGTANITMTGRFPVAWGDPDVVSPFGLTANGTMRTPGGETLRVHSQYRCVARSADMRCTQNVTVR